MKQDSGNDNKKAKVDKKLQKTRTTDTGVELEFGGMFWTWNVWRALINTTTNFFTSDSQFGRSHGAVVGGLARNK